MAQAPPVSGGGASEVPMYGPLCRTVDLGYELNSGTVFWPGGEGFCLCMNTSGASPEDAQSALRRVRRASHPR